MSQPVRVISVSSNAISVRNFDAAEIPRAAENNEQESMVQESTISALIKSEKTNHTHGMKSLIYIGSRLKAEFYARNR